jgi:tetratricopeptide (TPR) repeat protein
MQETAPEQKSPKPDFRVYLYRALIILSVGALLIWVAQSPQIWQRDTIVYAQAERRRLMAQPPGAAFPTYDQWRDNLMKMNTTLFYKDGVCANVAVSTGGNPPLRCLFTNGHPDASDGGDLENQILLAALPLLIKPDAKNVCVVGWGSGVTAGYALRFPIAKLVCAEIEPSVLQTSNLFAHVNFAPETDIRTQVVPADGRNYLLCTDEKFDVIISEPSNPWQAGVCNLFTREYFQICKDRLAPGGAFCFWSQVTEMPTKNLAEIISALRKVFPYIYIFDSGQGDVCAVALNDPGKISMALLEQTLASPALAQSLSRARVTSAEDLISRICMSPDGVSAAVASTSENTDDRNRLEFEIARSYENKVYRTQNADWMYAHHGSIWDFVEWRRSDKQAKSLELAAVATKCLERGSQLAEVWARESLTIFPNVAAYSCLIRSEMAAERFDEAVKIAELSVKAFARDAYLKDLQGTISFLQLDCVNAQRSFEQAANLDPRNPLIKYHLAQTYSRTYVGEKRLPHCLPPSGEPKKVIALCTEAAANQDFVMAYPSVLLLLADAYMADGKPAQAIPILENAVQYNLRASLAWKLLREANQRAGAIEKAQICQERERIFAQFEIEQMKKEVNSLLKDGKLRDAIGLLQTILETDASDQESRKLLTELAAKSDLAKAITKELPNLNSPKT